MSVAPPPPAARSPPGRRRRMSAPEFSAPAVADVDLQHGPGGDRQRAGHLRQPAGLAGRGRAALGAVQSEHGRGDPDRHGPRLGAAGLEEDAGDLAAAGGTAGRGGAGLPGRDHRCDQGQPGRQRRGARQPAQQAKTRRQIGASGCSSPAGPGRARGQHPRQTRPGRPRARNLRPAQTGGRPRRAFPRRDRGQNVRGTGIRPRAFRPASGRPATAPGARPGTPGTAPRCRLRQAGAAGDHPFPALPSSTRRGGWRVTQEGEVCPAPARPHGRGRRRKQRGLPGAVPSGLKDRKEADCRRGLARLVWTSWRKDVRMSVAISRSAPSGVTRPPRRSAASLRRATRLSPWTTMVSESPALLASSALDQRIRSNAEVANDCIGPSGRAGRRPSRPGRGSPRRPQRRSS